MEFISSAADPRYTDLRETSSREIEEPVPQRRPGTQRIFLLKFKFDNQHGYTMVKGMYSRTIRNLQLYGEYQDIQYIHALLVYL